MNFRILGELEIDDDTGRALTLGGARQRALLAILLLRRGEVVPADVLIEDLYDGSPPATAAKSLQAHVSRLRTALAPADRLQTRGGGYVLETLPGELDVERVETLLADGRQLLAAADAEQAAVRLDEALGCWRGMPLADLAYERFAQDEIARLHELRLECEEERLEANLALGRHAEVVAELERLVASHPLRERLRGQLMLALYRCGRQADALEAYHQGRRQLVDELGIDPGRSLRELERAILNQDPGLDPTQRPGTERETTALRGGRGDFVGREQELTLLDDALTGAWAGRGRLVLLSGEAGIGKSRLADELASRAAGRGARVLWGRCWEAGGAPAYWPWVQALRTYVRESEPRSLREELGAGAADVAHLVAEIRELFPDLPEPAALDSDGARFRLFDSTSAFLRRAATARPLVLVLDDLHAADAPSLLLLEFLCNELADAHVLIVAAYRDPELDTGDPIAVALTDVARRANTRIALGGLAATEIAAYIEGSAQGEPSAGLVAAVSAETDGNPLFVGEIVRLLAADGRLAEPADATWKPTIPETVKEVIGRRLSRLSADCRQTLVLASVLGREFSLEVLGALCDRPLGDVLAQLDEALAARVITDVPGSPGRMRFGHVLVRDTLYDALRVGQRRDLHRRAGEAIEAFAGADSPDHLSELAHHYFQGLPAVSAQQAVDYAQRAGDHAEAVVAHEEAARLYQTALYALTMLTPRPGHLELRLQLSLGDSLARAGDGPAARDAFLRAATLARSAGCAEELAEAALGYGGRIVWARAAGDRLVVTLLEEALAAVGERTTRERARVLARLAGALRDERDPHRRVALGELAVATAREIGDPGTLTYALAGLCAAQQGIGVTESRLETAAELREVGAAVADRESQCDGLCAEILVYGELNEFDAVRASTRSLAAYAAELRQPSQLWFASAFDTMLALHEGRLEDAELLVPETLQRGVLAQPNEASCAYAAHLYLLRREQGRAEEATEVLERAAAGNPARPFFRCALAAHAVDLGQTARARRHFEELAPNDFEIVPRDNEWLLAAAFLVEGCMALGDTDRAALLYAELVPLANRSTSNPPEGTIGAMARQVGVLASMLERHDEAIAFLRRAIEIDTVTRAVPWVAYAQAELAEMLDKHGDPGEARTLRDAARATAGALGLVRLATRVDASRVR